MPKQATQRLLLAATVCAWLIASAYELFKYLPLPLAALALLLGAAAVAAAMLWLQRLLRAGRDVPALSLAAPLLALLIAFAVLYPISQRHILGRGSDREDALRVESIALLHHQDPYAARTFLNNRPTPLPGAILLALPFFALGHIAWQNLLWTVAFFLFTLRYFRRRLTALFYVTLFLLLTPNCLQQFVNGDDYLTNLFYVLISLALLLAAARRGSLPLSLAAAAFLGLTLSSRPSMPLLLIPLLALLLQQYPLRRVALLFTAIVLTAAAVTLPFFQPHPIPQLAAQLAFTSSKLRYLPPALHAGLVLPLLALAVTATAFFQRMTLPRLLLLFSAGTAVVFLPPSLGIPLLALRLHVFSGRALLTSEFLTVSVLCFALWALARWETLALTPEPTQS